VTREADGAGVSGEDIGLVGLTNVVCQVGIAQQAVAAALRDPGAAADVAAARFDAALA
jgi:hypothetical protein